MNTTVAVAVLMLLAGGDGGRGGIKKINSRWRRLPRVI